jgi:hypothetical protein
MQRARWVPFRTLPSAPLAAEPFLEPTQLPHMAVDHGVKQPLVFHAAHVSGPRRQGLGEVYSPAQAYTDVPRSQEPSMRPVDPLRLVKQPDAVPASEAAIVIENAHPPGARWTDEPGHAAAECGIGEGREDPLRQPAIEQDH